MECTLNSPWSLNAKLLDFFSKNNLRDGFYIEAGAVNGIWQSNTLLLEQDLGWTGILIEPDPNLYEECKRYRKNNVIFNAALVDNEYKLPLVMGAFTPQTGDYDLTLQGVIDYKNPDFHFKKGTRRAFVPAVTLAQVIEQLQNQENYNIPKIDLLCLDVEGMEVQALDGLNLNINRPKYIIIETTGYDEKRKKIYNYLTTFDYKFLEQMTPNDAFYAAATEEGVAATNQ